MKFINDCDSLLPIEINLPYFNHGSNMCNNHEDLKIDQTTNVLDDSKIYDLLIIGGGLAGVSYAARANQMGDIDFVVIEKNDSLLNNFIYRTKKINQKVMRSSYKHHLGPVEQISLADFARLNYSKLSSGEKSMLERERKGERAIPSLPTFLKHSTHIINANNILGRTYCGEVLEIKQEENIWCIKTDNKTIKTRKIIFATGNEIKEEDLEQSDLKIPVFSALKNHSNEYLNPNISTVCVNGSGNTAAHIVYNALTKGKKVHWVLRSELVYRCADIPNEFWRTEGLISFNKLSLSKRMDLLNDIYHGSAMPEHKNIFRKFIKQKKLFIYENNMISKIEGKIVHLKNGNTFTTDILVKSFGLKPASLPKIEPVLETYKGFPVLNDENLEWYKGIYVGSSLAALSLGPAAKNIDGMRLAIERIFSDISINKDEITNGLLKNRNKWGTFGPIGEIKEEKNNALQTR